MGDLVNGSAAPLERVTDSMERPALDDRSYRVIRLPNKMEALLIHDAETDKVSASVDVNVGSLSDATDIPGLAHAVEHLLFMGTKKYPKENAYNQYLTAHSGHSNAFTASNSTNYHFEVSASSTPSNSPASSRTDISSLKSSSPLYGALDRFAQFFVEPLFLEETVDRELKAVDSENKKNLQNDTWRLHQLNKSLCNPAHPYTNFSTGNFKTLHDDPLARGVRIRDEFIKFYEKNYSANRMKLVVLGRESLDDLEQWVSELFSEVKNKDLPQNRWDDISVLTEKELMTELFAKPVTDLRSLDMYFTYPDEEDLYESQPGRYLSHLIGHEGPGSILAYIKAKGWANGLGAGPMPLCPGTAFFTISIRLTEEGLKNYKEVTKVVFQYLAMLRESEPREDIFEEMKRMSEVDFTFKQKSSAIMTTRSLSQVMQKPYKRDLLLSGPSIIRKFNPEGIRKGLSCLRPENFRLNVISQKYPGDWDQKEKWYGTEYKHEKIPQDFLEAIKSASDSKASQRPAELHLPHQNQFIPTRLEVEKKEIAEPMKHPVLLRNDDHVRLWYKKDDRFWVPKANVQVTLRSALINLTPRNAVIAHVYRDMVEDSLVEYAYDAEISGLDYRISTHSTGIDITVSGYNDKMSVLLEKVLLSMRDLEVREERFQISKERLLRGFRNAEFAQPYQQIGGYRAWLTSERGWINEEYLAELPDVTADDVRALYPQLLKQVHMEVLCHGNLYKEDALKMTDMVETTLAARALPPSQWATRRSLIFPEGCNYVYKRPLKDAANVNHAIEYCCAVSHQHDRAKRARLLLFAQMADEPAFNQLRTKEQLGYVVFSGATAANTWTGYRILIQSEKSPEYLETRIDAFLTAFGEELEQMTEKEFESHKTSVINRRLEKLKNLTQETGRFWAHVVSERYDFEQIDADVAHLTPLTKPDLLAFYTHYISPTSPARAKLAVHLVAQSLPTPPPASDRLSAISTLLLQFLNSEGVGAEPEGLGKRLECVDVGRADAGPAVVEAVRAYVVQDLSIEKGRAEGVIEGARKVLEAALPGLGLEGAGEAGAQVQVDGANGVPAGKEPVLIEDVKAFKMGMEVSRGARPVVDLSVFEEVGSKL